MTIILHKKCFPLRKTDLQFLADSVTFTEKILNEKRHSVTLQFLKCQIEVVFFQETGYYHS